MSVQHYSFLSLILCTGLVFGQDDKPAETLAHQPLKPGLIDDAFLGSMLPGMASMTLINSYTYNVPEIALPYTQLKKYAKSDASGTLIFCSQKVRNALVDLLKDTYNIAQADSMHYYHMNEYAQKTTQFPGIMVIKVPGWGTAVIVDEEFFNYQSRTRPDNQKIIAAYAATLIDQHFHYTQKTAQLAAGAVTQAIVTHLLLPKAMGITCGAATFLGCGVIATFCPALAGCSSFVTSLLLYSLLASFVTPVTAKPADYMLGFAVHGIDQKVCKKMSISDAQSGPACVAQCLASFTSYLTHNQNLEASPTLASLEQRITRLNQLAA